MLVLYLNLCANRLALPDDTHKGAAQTAIRPNSNDDANTKTLAGQQQQGSRGKCCGCLAARGRAGVCGRMRVQAKQKLRAILKCHRVNGADV